MRGSREQRIAEMRSLGDAEWNPGTLLYLHIGLLDHAEDVRSAALDALLEISRRQPEPLTISPVTLLSYSLFDWTVPSGNTLRIFSFLAELGTPEADEAIEAIMEGPVEQLRNEDFEEFMSALAENGKMDTIDRLANRKISTTKNKILRKVIERF
jgi:hypothetical protein